VRNLSYVDDETLCGDPSLRFGMTILVTGRDLSLAFEMTKRESG
jgi:hypothetical protein